MAVKSFAFSYFKSDVMFYGLPTD